MEKLILGAFLILAVTFATVIFLIFIGERIVHMQNIEAMKIFKLHPASYRKVENRFKEIKEDQHFINKKYLYERKEWKVSTPNFLTRKKKKCRRPHINSRYKEDEWTEISEDKFMTSGGSAENSGSLNMS